MTIGLCWNCRNKGRENYSFNTKKRSDRSVRCPYCGARKNILLISPRDVSRKLSENRYVDSNWGPREYQNLLDLPKSMVHTWCAKYRYKKSDDINKNWIREWLDCNEETADNVLEILKEYSTDIRPGRKKDRKKDPGPKTKIDRKLKLKPGDIEHFHRRYRKFKELHPDREPQAHHVREWFRDSGHRDTVLYRWAVELLEKHKPKEYRES